MNILEAFKAVRNGQYIRFSADEKIYYVLQVTEVPMGQKRIIRLVLEDLIDDASYPTCFDKLNNYDFVTIESICIESLENESFEVITEEQLFKEIKESWKNEQL